MTVFVEVRDDRVEGVSFEGTGCAISKASASMMTEAIVGKSVEDAMDLFERFQGLVTSDPTQPPQAEELGKLGVFAGVREFPMRVKCATLSWHTFRAAVAGDMEPVKTE